jgi:transcriptional regulator with XRE-family HTH domain
MTDMPIGKAIARARQRKRWTQVELAERVGVNESAVVAWETGRHFPARNLGAIEDALGIDLAGYEAEAEVAS